MNRWIRAEWNPHANGSSVGRKQQKWNTNTNMKPGLNPLPKTMKSPSCCECIVQWCFVQFITVWWPKCRYCIWFAVSPFGLETAFLGGHKAEYQQSLPADINCPKSVHDAGRKSFTFFLAAYTRCPNWRKPVSQKLLNPTSVIVEVSEAFGLFCCCGLRWWFCYSFPGQQDASVKAPA